MLIEQKATVGLAQGKRTDLVPNENQVDSRPTLADMGISKKLSSNAQTLAGLDDQEFDTLVETSVERTANSAATHPGTRPSREHGGTMSEPPSVPTLADMGISKKQSSRCYWPCPPGRANRLNPWRLDTHPLSANICTHRVQH